MPDCARLSRRTRARYRSPQNPDILRISTATNLIEDPYLTQISDGKRWAQVFMIMQNRIRHDAAPQTLCGDTDLPLTYAEISDNFHLFSDPVLGSKAAETIENLCSKFNHLDAT